MLDTGKSLHMARYGVILSWVAHTSICIVRMCKLYIMFWIAAQVCTHIIIWQVLKKKDLKTELWSRNHSNKKHQNEGSSDGN